MDDYELRKSTRRRPTGGKAPHHIVTYALDDYSRVLQYSDPLYLLGIEKIVWEDWEGEITCDTGFLKSTCIDLENIYLKEQPHYRHLRDRHYWPLINDSRHMLMTHIAYFPVTDVDDGHNEGPCMPFNVYPDLESSNRCNGAERYGNNLTAAQLYSAGYEALSNREGFVFRHFKKTVRYYEPTHVFLLSTGFNTAETESLDNYRDWISVIRRNYPDAQSAEFRPLYVGIAWQSEWGCPLQLPFLCKIFRTSGGGIKGNDADETGLVWGNLLISRVLKPLKDTYGFKLIAIGHSYGGRIVTESVLRNAVHGYDGSTTTDVLVGIQAAFSRNRFDYRDNGDGQMDFAPFTAIESAVGLALFTCSRSDSAMLPTYVGRCGTTDELIEAYSRYGSASSDTSGTGKWFPVDSDSSNAVYFLDASNFINRRKPDTGGGAHSDVYDDAIGRMIWDAISRLSSTQLGSN